VLIERPLAGIASEPLELGRLRLSASDHALSVATKSHIRGRARELAQRSTRRRPQRLRSPSPMPFLRGRFPRVTGLAQGLEVLLVVRSSLVPRNHVVHLACRRDAAAMLPERVGTNRVRSQEEQPEPPPSPVVAPPSCRAAAFLVALPLLLGVAWTEPPPLFLNELRATRRPTSARCISRHVLPERKSALADPSRDNCQGAHLLTGPRPVHSCGGGLDCSPNTSPRRQPCQQAPRASIEPGLGHRQRCAIP
jgi:hypothetical protein